jgi:hypothetical protein
MLKITKAKNLEISGRHLVFACSDPNSFQAIGVSAFAVRDSFLHHKKRESASFLHRKELVDILKMLGNMPLSAPRCSGLALFICL